MGFADDWKKAKTAFETATKAKKPSATFLGVFSKGTGIGSALKDADSAKTAGDLRKAVAALKKASTDYTVTLDKAINDPKAVASDAKKAYADASKKLKEQLAAIAESALATAASLEKADKKTAVDPAQQRKQVEALKAVKEHVALRQRVFLALEKISMDFTKRGFELENTVKLAEKQLATAKAAKAKGETMQAGIAAGAVGQFADKAAGTLKAMQSEWDKYAAGGGELMKARSDGGIDYQSLAPGDQHYRAESNSLFGAGDKVQQGIQAKLKSLATKVLEARAMAEEAEKYQVVGVKPEVHLARVAEIAKRVTALKAELEIRVGKAEGWERMTPELVKKDAKGKLQNIELTRGILAKHAEAVKEVGLLQGRLKALPESALDDRAVTTAVTDANKLIAAFAKDAPIVATKGQALIKALGG
ncbi:MAG: hypothetical protein ACM3N6_15325 [Betaproteobacteria bacterium]